MADGLLEQARKALKSRKSVIEDRLQEILGNGRTSDRQQRVQPKPEDNQDTKRANDGN